MKMRKIWRIQVDLGTQGYSLANWVGKTEDRSNYTPDRALNLLYQCWSIILHMTFSYVPVSDDFPNYSHLPLLHPPLCHYLTTQSQVITVYFSLP